MLSNFTASTHICCSPCPLPRDAPLSSVRMKDLRTWGHTYIWATGCWGPQSVLEESSMWEICLSRPSLPQLPSGFLRCLGKTMPGCGVKPPSHSRMFCPLFTSHQGRGKLWVFQAWHLLWLQPCRWLDTEPSQMGRHTGCDLVRWWILSLITMLSLWQPCRKRNCPFQSTAFDFSSDIAQAGSIFSNYFFEKEPREVQTILTPWSPSLSFLCVRFIGQWWTIVSSYRSSNSMESLYLSEWCSRHEWPGLSNK